MAASRMLSHRPHIADGFILLNACLSSSTPPALPLLCTPEMAVSHSGAKDDSLKQSGLENTMPGASESSELTRFSPHRNPDAVRPPVC